MKYIALALFLQIAVVLGQNYPGNFQYYVPRPTFKAFNPFGYRMSIPDWPGIESVTFDVKIDQRIPGQPQKEQTYQAQRTYWSNRWSIWDQNTQINGGDQVYFTVTVKKDGQVYKYENGRILVTEHAFSSQESIESGSYGSSEERQGRYRYWLWNQQRNPQQNQVY